MSVPNGAALPRPSLRPGSVCRHAARAARSQLAGTGVRVPAAFAGIYLAAAVAGFVLRPWDLTPPRNPVPLSAASIAANNLFVVLVLFLGAFALLVPTLVCGAWNGFLVGALLAYVAPHPNWLAGTLAHGIPEVAGQWCAVVGGAELFRWLVAWLRGRPPPPLARALAWGGLAVGLTCVAAVVEAVVSPLLISVLA